MSEQIVYGIAMFSVLALGAAVFIWFKSKQPAKEQPQALALAPAIQNIPTEETLSEELGPELIVIDAQGRTLASSRIITQIPAHAPVFSNLNDPAVKCGQQLAAELLKGVVTLPGKTLELVFDPEIQKRLSTIHSCRNAKEHPKNHQPQLISGVENSTLKATGFAHIVAR